MTAYWPNGTTKPGTITDRYGPRKPIRGSRPFHYGVDVDTDEGDLIHAAMDGVVIFSGDNGSLGQQIVVQSERYQFLYPHNKRGTLPPVGQKVSARQAMCETGLTGNTTGYHSCFRIFEGSWERDANARNPEQVMAQLNGGALASTIILGIFREEGEENMKYVHHVESGGFFGIEFGKLSHFTSTAAAQYNCNFFTAEDKVETMNTDQWQSVLKGCGIPLHHPDRLQDEDPGGTWSFEQENINVATRNQQILTALAGKAGIKL